MWRRKSRAFLRQRICVARIEMYCCLFPSRSVGICVTTSFPKQLQTKLIEYETGGSMMIKESRSLRTSCFHVLVFESQSFLFDGGVIPFLSWHQDHLFQLRPRAWGLLVDG